MLKDPKFRRWALIAAGAVILFVVIGLAIGEPIGLDGRPA